MNPKSPIATRIRMLRARQNITQEAAASPLGVSAGLVGKWERGESEPNASEIAKLCEMFHVCADYLVGISHYPQGLAPDSWIVDVDEVREIQSEGKVRRLLSRNTNTWCVKVPRRYIVVDYAALRRIEQQGLDEGEYGVT